MEQVIDFIGNNVLLVSAWLLTLLMIVWNESRKSGKAVSTAEATKLINKEDAVILDIRPKKEWATGHITGAVHIPSNEIDNRLTELDKYKSRPVIVTCNLGQTAGGVTKKLAAAGFSNVARLSGGISEWKNQSLPLVKGK